jgi:hypothetical protein
MPCWVKVRGSARNAEIVVAGEIENDQVVVNRRCEHMQPQKQRLGCRRDDVL